MRITQNITSDNSLFNIQQARAKLDSVQEQIASGLQINRPSDDPINANLLLDIDGQLKAGEQYASNITKSTLFLKVTSTALQGMSDIMQQTKELVATINNGSSDPAMRQNAVSQLQAMKQQLVDMGNTQLGNQFVFGGANNLTPPFSATAPFYSGDETALSIEIGQSTSQKLNLPGNQVLTGSSAQVPAVTPYGNSNILDTFDKMITAVQNNDVNGVNGIIAEEKNLEAGAGQIVNAQNDVALRLVRLDSTAKMNDTTKSNLHSIAGNLQNVDYAKLAVELTQQQLGFQAALSATAKISQLSLLDYLK